jgi:polyhydroxyalkanoate synthesis regulator phasin
MFELIRKSLLATLGAAVLTKEKIQEVTFSLVEQGKISTEEAEKLADDLVKSGQSQWDEVQSKVSESVRRSMDSLDLSRKTEFQELKARVENLEKRVTILETTQAVAKETEHGN